MAQQFRATIPHTALALLTLPLLASPVQAQSYYDVAKTGSDSNPCTQAAPCLTIQAAVNKVPLGTIAGIRIGDGIYNEAVNIYYHRAVAISGNCSNLSGVTVAPPAGNAAFTIQDHAITSLTCLTIAGSGSP